MANIDYKNGKLIEIIREFDNTDSRYEINGITQAIAVPFWRKETEKFQVIPKGAYRYIQESGNNYLEILDNTILEQAIQFQICYVYSQISSKYIEDFPELTVLVNKYNELIDDTTKLFSYLKSVGMTSDTLQLTKVMSQLEPLTTWYMDELGEIKALPISDLYGKFNQMIEHLKNKIEELLNANLNDTLLKLIEKLKEETDRLLDLLASSGNNLKPKQVPDIEFLKRVNAKVDEVYEVLGYYKFDDGATHKRVISRNDDGSGILLKNGLYANILHNGEIKTSWFGIKNDESIDDTSTFNKILNYSDNIFVDRNVNIDKVVFPSNKTIYGKKISAVQIQLGYKCTIKDISLFPKKTVENIPFLYINGNEFPSTKSEILIKDIFIPGIEFDRRNRDFFVIEISDNHGIWGITVDGVRSEGRMNFRTIFKFKAHKLKSNISHYPWITYTRIKNVSIIGGINMLELLTYYTQDGEYGYISDSKGAVISVQIDNCHFESNGLALTMLRLGNYANVKMNNSFIGDFFQYDVDCSKYFVLDNRNRKNFNSCRFLGFTKDWELTEKRYKNIHFLDNDNKISLATYNCSFISQSSGNVIPVPDTFDMLKRFYSFNYNFYTTKERYFIIAKFPKEDIYNYVLLTFILNNATKEKTHNINFFSFSCESDIKTIEINTNISELKSLHLYEKSGNYYLILKANKDNRLNAFICNSFLISRKLYAYFWEGTQEEFNSLGLTLIREITISSVARVSQLNTLYYAEKMKQENVYDDYITYLDEKVTYDKQQEKLEEQRYLAYQSMLKENKELTYEEFLSIQPMILNLIEEPQPSEALKKFMDKYL